jgi:hypothetical protein
MVEVLPELARLLGFPGDSRISRRISVACGKTASINRAMSLRGFSGLFSMIISLQWMFPTVLDCACAVFDQEITYLSSIHFNHLEEFGIRLVGQEGRQDFFIDFQRLGERVGLLVVAVTSSDSLSDVGVISLSLLPQSNDLAFFAMQVNTDKTTRNSEICLAIYRPKTSREWMVMPVREFANLRSPADLRVLPGCLSNADIYKH